MILSLDLDAMACTTLLASPEGFRQEGGPEPWEEKHRRLMAAIPPEDREQMEEHWQQELAKGRVGNRFSAAFRSTLLQEGGKYGEAIPVFSQRVSVHAEARLFFSPKTIAAAVGELYNMR